MKTAEEEIWKDIPDYIGKYQVSNLGRVRSLERIIIRSDDAVRHFKMKVLKQSKGCGRYGFYYWKVNLSKESKIRTFSVHILMAKVFLNHSYSKNRGLVIDHKDGDSLNNNINNLQIITQKENCIKDKKPKYQ